LRNEKLHNLFSSSAITIVIK